MTYIQTGRQANIHTERNIALTYYNITNITCITDIHTHTYMHYTT